MQTSTSLVVRSVVRRNPRLTLLLLLLLQYSGFTAAARRHHCVSGLRDVIGSRY